MHAPCPRAPTLTRAVRRGSLAMALRLPTRWWVVAQPRVRYPSAVSTHPAQTRLAGPAYAGIGYAEATAVGPHADDEVWHVQIAPGDVRVLTLDKLGDLYRLDIVDENMFVWQQEMSDWVQLGTLLGALAPEPEPEDPFHVLMGPGEVKVLTLERLDDLYRLGLINESTYVWQQGMSEWQPLGIAAGLHEPASDELPTAPQHPLVGQSRPPVQPTVAAQQNVNSSPKAVSRHEPLPRTTTAPPILSAPPVAFEIESPYPPKGARATRWLVRMAVAAGVVLALLRNDVVHAMLQDTPLIDRYNQAETSLIGGPAFGTSRSVEHLVASCGGHLEAVRLPLAVTKFTDTRDLSLHRTPDPQGPTAVAPTVGSAADAASSSARSKPQPALAAAAPSMSTKAEGPDAGRPQEHPETSALGGVPPKAAPTAAKPRSVPHPVRKRSTGGASGPKSGGSYFDPLNAAL